MIERIKLRCAECVFEALVACQYQTNTRLPVANEIGDQSEFVQQVDAERVSFVDQQQDPVGTALVRFQVFNQRKSQFTFIQSSERLIQLEQDCLQQSRSRVQPDAARIDHSKLSAILFFQHRQHQRLASSNSSDNDDRARCPVNANSSLSECRMNRFASKIVFHVRC